MGLAVGCERRAPGRVDAADYRAFFIWAGVKPQPEVATATSLYVLSGEIRRDTGFVRLRSAPRLRRSEVWLVLRVERLDWSEALHDTVLRELAHWQALGNPLAGLQIDFDAATKGLENYAAFLADLRRRLPKQFRLSITGLMDWSANGDPTALAGLAGIVDEVVVQTYQGRKTIPGYAAYIDKLPRLPIPHKVALVQGGEWTEPAALRRDPLFKGYVVFLLNQPAN